MPDRNAESRIASEILGAWPVDCVCRPRWYYKVQIRKSPTTKFRYTLIAGDRPESTRPFSAEDIDRVFAFLESASWLESPDLVRRGRPRARASTLKLYAEIGDLGFNRVAPDSSEPLPAASPAASRLVEPSPVAMDLLALRASFSGAEPPWLSEFLARFDDGGPPAVAAKASLAGIAEDLAELRRAWLVAKAVRERDESFLEAFNARHNPGHWDRLAPFDSRFASGSRRQAAAARVWFANRLGARGLTPWKVGRFSGPHRLDAPPCSPLGLLWAALAVAAGAIRPPVSAKGLVTCAYEPCQIAAIVRPQRVRGSHRFCSESCRQSFHAAAATARRRRSQDTRE